MNGRLKRPTTKNNSVSVMKKVRDHHKSVVRIRSSWSANGSHRNALNNYSERMRDQLWKNAEFVENPVSFVCFFLCFWVGSLFLNHFVSVDSSGMVVSQARIFGKCNSNVNAWAAEISNLAFTPNAVELTLTFVFIFLFVVCLCILFSIIFVLLLLILIL